MHYLFHAYLCVFLQMAGFIGGAIVALVLGNGQSFLLQAVLFFGCPTAGVYLPSLIFSRVLHASCPKCGGVARQQRGKRLSYLCDQCGHQAFTSIGEGDG